jgi:hypothetical protein
VLAAAEVNGLRFSGLEFDWRKAATLVAAVAEGLTSTLPAGAPVIALAGFDRYSIGTLLGNRWFWHKGFSLKGSTDIIAEIGEPRHNSESDFQNAALSQGHTTSGNLPAILQGILLVNRKQTSAAGFLQQLK